MTSETRTPKCDALKASMREVPWSGHEGPATTTAVYAMLADWEKLARDLEENLHLAHRAIETRTPRPVSELAEEQERENDAKLAPLPPHVEHAKRQGAALVQPHVPKAQPHGKKGKRR